MEGLVQHIEESIANAIEGKSKLIPEILGINGMSSSRNRHLLNNIVSGIEGCYLEIGIWKGSTFISALYKNSNFGYSIDDWSGDVVKEDVRTSFLINTTDFGIDNFKLIEKDCFTVDITSIESKINIFFYDGEHSRALTRESLVYFYNVLDNEFVFIVDDYDWQEVQLGVMDGIKKTNLEIVYEKHLKSDCMNDAETWWNGIGIFILRKNKI
jgi:hypothetical protein